MDGSMMDRDRERKRRLQRLASQTQNVSARSLLPYLHCLPDSLKEQVRCKETTDGPMAAAQLLFEQLWKRDGWYKQLVPALREEGYNELADKIEGPEKKSSPSEVSPPSQSQLGRDLTGFSPPPRQETSRAEPEKSPLTATQQPILEPEAKVSPSPHPGSSTRDETLGTPSPCSVAHRDVTAVVAPASQPGGFGADVAPLNGSQNVSSSQNVPSDQRSTQVEQSLLSGAVDRESSGTGQGSVSEPQGGIAVPGCNAPTPTSGEWQASLSNLEARNSSQIAAQTDDSTSSVHYPTPDTAVSPPIRVEGKEIRDPSKLYHQGAEFFQKNSPHGDNQARSYKGACYTDGPFSQARSNVNLQNDLDKSVSQEVRQSSETKLNNTNVNFEVCKTPKTSPIPESPHSKKTVRAAKCSNWTEEDGSQLGAQPLTSNNLPQVDDALQLDDSFNTNCLFFSKRTCERSGPMRNDGASQENLPPGAVGRESPGTSQRPASEPQDNVVCQYHTPGSAGSSQEEGGNRITFLSILRRSRARVINSLGEYILQQ